MLFRCFRHVKCRSRAFAFTSRNKSEFEPVFKGDSLRDPSFNQKWNTLQTVQETSARQNFTPKGTTVVPGVLFLKNGPDTFQSVSVRSRTNELFFINPQHIMQHYQMVNYGATIKNDTKKNILFTALNWNELVPFFSSFYVNKKFPNFNIYGPMGITKILYRILRTTMSRYKFENFVANMAVFELHDPYTEFQAGEVKIKGFNNSSAGIPICAFVIESPINKVKVCPEKLREFEEDEKSNFSEPDFKKVVYYLEHGVRMLHPKTGEKIRPDTIGDLVIENRSFVAMECPTLGHFQSLDKNPRFQINDEVNYVGHWTPKEVFKNPVYDRWMQKTSPDCLHKFLGSGESKNNTFIAYDLNRMLLNQCNPVLFPIYEKKRKSIEQFLKPLKDNDLEINDPYHYFMASSKLKSAKKLRFNPLCRSVKSISDKIDTLNQQDSFKPVKQSYPKLVILGSGGSAVSVIRSSPAYLLQISEKKSILIDCSASTYLQMHRHFGPDNLRYVMSTISAIYISHRHADHFGGLPSFLGHLFRICPSTNVNVVLPLYISHFIDHNLNFSYRRNVHLFPLYNNPIIDEASRKKLQNALKIKSFEPVLVDHGVSTYGLVLQDSNWKIVYSSDTLPMCKALIKAGKGADLLIHDSLYISNLQQTDAEFRKHSVAKGAIATAHEMQAKNLMLTHIEPNHAIPLPINLEDDRIYKGNLLYGIDHMELSFDTLKLFPDTHKKLLEVFEKEVDHFKKKLARKQPRYLAKQKEYTETYEMLQNNGEDPF